MSAVCPQSKYSSPEAVQGPAAASSSVKGWIIWGTAGLFYLYEMVLRVSPSVMTHQLMEDFQVSSTTLGVLTSFYYYAYVALQVPCGLFVDKLGARKIVTLSALLCAGGTILFALSDTLIIAQTGRFLIGAGSACAFISCLKVTAEWFAPSRFALMAGLSNMMGTLGATFGGRPLALLVNTAGWREALWVAAIAGVVVALFSWLFMRDRRNFLSSTGSHPLSLMDSLRKTLRNRQVWLAGISGGLMYLPISAFSELWAIPFLMSAYGVDNATASMANVMLFIGMALGGPLAAFLAEKKESYLSVMKLSALLTAFLFIAIGSCAHLITLQNMFFLLFMAGLTIGGQVLCFSCAQLYSTQKTSGTTMAFTNALVMMSGVIFQPLLGMILDISWDGSLSEKGIRLYSYTCYQYSVLTVPFFLVISWFFLRLMKERTSWLKHDKI